MLAKLSSGTGGSHGVISEGKQVSQGYWGASTWFKAPNRQVVSVGRYMQAEPASVISDCH